MPATRSKAGGYQKVDELINIERTDNFVEYFRTLQTPNKQKLASVYNGCLHIFK
jgi:hypothetical protein